jgi:hypothetical protein
MNNCKHEISKFIYTYWCPDCGATKSILTPRIWVPPTISKEIVICSAIRLPDGKNFRGHRHSDCIETAFKFVTWNGGNDPGEHHWNADMCSDQGFITSCNRYIDREEGLQLQISAGIDSVCPSGYRANNLFSEDLY